MSGSLIKELKYYKKNKKNSLKTQEKAHFGYLKLKKEDEISFKAELLYIKIKEKLKMRLFQMI